MAQRQVQPFPKVLSHMLYRVYPWALRRAGLHASEAQLDTIEDLLWKVKLTDGERNMSSSPARRSRPQAEGRHERRRAARPEGRPAALIAGDQ